MSSTLPGVAIVFDDTLLKFGEKAEGLYRGYKKLNPVPCKISGHHLLELPMEIYYSFNFPQLAPHLRVFILRRESLEFFVCDFHSGFVTFWASMPIETLQQVRNQFTQRDFSICDVRVYHGYQVYPERIARLEYLGVPENYYHLFFLESFSLTQEEVEHLNIPYDPRCDHHFHPFTNILWRSLIEDGTWLNGFVVKRQPALILHAWWRGYNQACMLTSPKEYTIFLMPDVKIRVSKLHQEVYRMYLHSLYDEIRAAWLDNPSRKTNKWVDFTVETSWLNIYCAGKEFVDVSIVNVKGMRLAPLQHKHWSKVAKPYDKIGKQKASAQRQVQDSIVDDVHIVAPKVYGLTESSLFQNNTNSDEDEGLPLPLISKDSLLQRGLKLFKKAI